jgi:hypothetical protein
MSLLAIAGLTVFGVLPIIGVVLVAAWPHKPPPPEPPRTIDYPDWRDYRS